MSVAGALSQRARQFPCLPEAQAKSIGVQKVRAPAARGFGNRGDDGDALFGEPGDDIVDPALSEVKDQRRGVAPFALHLEEHQFEPLIEGAEEPEGFGALLTAEIETENVTIKAFRVRDVGDVKDDRGAVRFRQPEASS